MSSNESTMVQHWIGQSWSIVASPNPDGSESAYLAGASCPPTPTTSTPTVCMAVGGSRVGSAHTTLAERYVGEAPVG
jgi:hypothetical protein